MSKTFKKIISSSGFSLVEMAMIISLLAIIGTVTVNRLGDSVNAQRFELTRMQMESLRTAILGDNTVNATGHRVNFGYVGDWGSLPAALSNLTSSGAPAWSFNSTYGFGAGWRGPYTTGNFSGIVLTNDAWGHSFVYSTSGTPTLTSYAADNASGGSGYDTDIIMQMPTTTWQATMHGTVLNGTLPVSGKTVELRYPVAGTITAFSGTTDASGYFTFSGVPFGVHSIAVTAPAPTIAARQIAVDHNNYQVPEETLNYLGLGANVQTSTCNGRLTLTSGTPVPTSDVTSAGTIYYTPYNGNQIGIYDGATWGIYSFTELSLALTLTSGKNYDVFIYNNLGNPALELGPAWTNDTTRATNIVLQDGVYVKSGATSRRYVGTIRASGANVTEDSNTKRFVWNLCNQVPRRVYRIDPTGNWAYNNSTIRQANGNAANQIEIINGIQMNNLYLSYDAQLELNVSGADDSMAVGIGENSVTAYATNSAQGYFRIFVGSVAGRRTAQARFMTLPQLGYSYYAMLERGTTGQTTTFFGDPLRGLWPC